LLLALAAGQPACRREASLRPVVPGTGTWGRTVVLPLLGARFNLRAPRKLFRDDGLFQGDLSIHTQEIEREFTADSIKTSGKASEGLLTEGARPDGTRCFAVYGLSTGDRQLDRARREMLRARAVVALGMREGLERYFRQAGVKVQFRTVSDRGLTKLVEAYALTRANYPLDQVRDLETRQMAQLLLDQGIGRDTSRPIGTRHGRQR
jgi:hypothetical protein